MPRFPPHPPTASPRAPPSPQGEGPSRRPLVSLSSGRGRAPRRSCGRVRGNGSAVTCAAGCFREVAPHPGDGVLRRRGVGHGGDHDLPGAIAAVPGRMADQQYRGGLDQRHLLRRLCGCGVGTGQPDRPGRSAPGLHRLHRPGDGVRPGLRPLGPGAVVGDRVPAARRGGAGGHLHAGAADPQRPAEAARVRDANLAFYTASFSIGSGFSVLLAGLVAEPLGLALGLRGRRRLSGACDRPGAVGRAVGCGGRSIGTVGRPAGLPAGAAQPARHGLCAGLCGALRGTVRVPVVAGRLPDRRGGGGWRTRPDRNRLDRHDHPAAGCAGEHLRQ